MSEQRRLVAEHPELSAFTPGKRFRTIETGRLGVPSSALDTSGAAALLAAVGEFDPALHAVGEGPLVAAQQLRSPQDALARRSR